MSVRSLSKSKFIAGLQCLKRLWNECHRADETPEWDPATQAMFDAGHEVGAVARGLFPGGRLVEQDHTHHTDAADATRKLMTDPSIPAVFEGAFTFEDIRIRADILGRVGRDKWKPHEVKSTTEVKPYHLYDAAIQRRVLEGCGVRLAAVCLVHINNRYVHDGKRLDLEKLFVVNDVTRETERLGPDVAALLSAEREALGRAEPPAVEPGRHCHDPYTCEWWEECRATKPKHWTIELYRADADKLLELRQLGFEDIASIPDSASLTTIQRRVRDCVRSGQMSVSRDLRTAFSSVQRPVHYLDFETIAPPIPRYRGTRPYQTLPFQWSAHVRRTDGTLEHRQWLCDGDRDPAPELATALVDTLGDSGTVMCYTSYERTVLRGLARRLPHLRAKLDAADRRLWDLCNVVRNNIYHPDFRGSFSLKSVLPVLVPDMAYQNLDIQDGTTAGLAYLEAIAPQTSSARRAELRRQLLEYCRQDSLGLAKLHEKCLQLAQR